MHLDKPNKKFKWKILVKAFVPREKDTYILKV